MTSIDHTEKEPQDMCEQHYRKDFQMARRMQEALLQVKTPEISGIKIVKKCIPAETIGGDFYGFSHQNFQGLSQEHKIPGVIEYIDRREDYLGITVGDVAGHGVSSALVMALASGLFNESSRTFKSPADVLKNTNEQLISYLENSQVTYVTAFYSALNLDKMTLTYAKAGHPNAIILHSDKTTEILDTSGVFLGMYSNETFEEKTIQLHGGDRIFFYTDGILEARNPRGELFDSKRFLELILSLHDKPIETVLDTVFKSVTNFTQVVTAQDDQTLVILEILEKE